MPSLLKIAVYVSIGLILFFMLRKKRPKPSQLEMGLSKHRSNRVNKNALTGLRKVTAEVVDDTKRDLSDIIYFEGKPYNVWQVLGVPSGASQAEVKRAFAEKSSLPGVNQKLLLLAYKKVASQ